VRWFEREPLASFESRERHRVLDRASDPFGLPPNGGVLGVYWSAQTERVTELDTQRHFATCNTYDSTPRTRCLPWIASALLVMCTMCGCGGSPSRNILGSYFPSWMVCALAGLAAALIARVALKTSGLLAEVPAPLVVLLSIGCATTFALWLLWLA
jgi:hypothetical protein